jgi:MYXO-CTERM domain-containing protein
MTRFVGDRHMRFKSLLGGALCLVGQSACSGQEAAKEPGGSDETQGIDSSQIRDTLAGAEPLSNLTFTRDVRGTQRVVKFRSLGREFTLELVPNHELFDPKLVVVRNGMRLTAQEAGLETPLRGSVEGDPKSWVRARAQGDGVEGLVFTDHQLYEIRPHNENRFDLRMGRADIGDYVENPTGNEAHCGVIESNPLVDTPPPADDDLLAQQGCMWIGIHVIADYTFAGKTGGASGAENEMATRMNEIDGIYRADINRAFRIEEVTSHDTSGGPGYNAPGLDINSQLGQLRTWKQTNDPQRGLVHLFAGRVTSGAVGLAYLPGICSAASGAGVSNYLGTSRSSTICPAHEIGHNFGANHDGQGAPYIMAPSVNRTATTFSDTSKSQMNSAYAALGSQSRPNCFTPCGAAGAGGTGGSGGGGGSGGSNGSGGSSGSGGNAGTGGTGGGFGGSGGSGGSGAGGDAGSTGSGGSGGSGGSVGGSGGDAGVGGSGVGGSGVGGSGVGGSGVGGSGVGGSGVGGSGGAGPAGTGGAGGVAGTGAGAVGGVGGTEAEDVTLGPGVGLDENQSGCACRVAEPKAPSPLALLAALGMLGVLGRRRGRGARD